MNERARIEIGAVDFGALFYGRPAPAAYALVERSFELRLADQAAAVSAGRP